MTFVGAVVVALIAAWMGSRFQAARVRRQWQTEVGVSAWREFVNGLHAWRRAIEILQSVPLDEGQRARAIKNMNARLWSMSPEAPAIHVFAPPTVDRAARDLLRTISQINEDAAAGRALAQGRIDEFDQQKWDFVVLASSAFRIK